MKTAILPVALLFALASAAPTARAEEGGATNAAPADELEEQFYRAYYAENGLRDFAKAGEQYAEVFRAARTAGRNDLAVKALLGRARCMRTIGNADEAKAAIEGVIALDPENEEARAASAEEEGASPDDALLHRIRDLILNGLYNGSSDSARELLLLGDRCLPELEKALYETNLGRVEAAATYLASLGGPAASDILIRAMRDPNVVFRSAIARAVCRPTDGGWLGGERKPFSAAEIAVLAVAAEFPEAEIRRLVHERLVYTGDRLGEAGVSLLLRLATDPDRSVRMAILVHAIDWLASDVVLGLVPALRRSMASEDTGERRAAVALAGRYTEVQRALADPLRALLRDPDSDVRAAAFQSLSTVLSEDDLAGFLDPADPALAGMAMNQLSGRLPLSPSTAVKVREAIERTIRGEFGDHGLQFVRFVEAGLLMDRTTLVDLFARTGAPDAKGHRSHLGKLRQSILNQLRQPLSWNQSPQKEQAVALVEEGVEKCFASGEALRGWVGFWSGTGVPAYRAWIRAAASDDEGTRRLAYSALLRSDPNQRPELTPGSLPHLDRDLVSADGQTRTCALQLVTQAGASSPALAEPLRKLHDAADRWEDRSHLLRALVAAAGREAEPVVRADLDHPEVRATALQMLVNELGIGDRRELDAFVAAGGDPGVVVGLADKPNPPDRSLLRGFVNELPLEKYTYSFVPAAARCVDGAARLALLRNALHSDGPLVRVTATKAIGDMRVLELWPDLVTLLESGSADVRAAAEKSLAALKTYAELKSSFANFGKDEQDAARRNAEELLKSGEPLKRKGAVLALAALGDRAAIPALLKALDDEHLVVREAALAALERLGGKPTEPK